MNKTFVLTDGQTGYDVIGEYIRRYWEEVCCTTVIVSVETSYDGKSFCKYNIIASPTAELTIEYVWDWWEGEKYIILNGIIDIHDIEVDGGIFEPLERSTDES